MSLLPDAICNKCTAPATLMCQRCLETYCCSDCQIHDWKEHKNKCYQMPNLVPIKKTPRSSGYLSGINDSMHSQQMRRPYNPNSKPSHNETRRNLNYNNNHNSSSVNQNLPKHAERPLLEDKDFRLKPRVVDKPAAWTSHFVPPKNVFFEVIVQFVEELDPSVVWVSELKNSAAMRKLLSEIQRGINKELSSSPLKNLSIGALVAAPLNELFYRAEVLELSDDSSQHAATVRLIDYGNEIHLPLSKLHPPIPIMCNLNAYAFRIRIPKDCNGSLELESLLTVRLLSEAKMRDGLYRVEVKPKSVPLTLPVEELSLNPAVVPLKVLPGGRHALLQSSSITFSTEAADMNAFLNTEQGLKFDFDNATLPGNGAFVAARTDAYGWRRASLLGYAAKKHCYLVYLIDDGKMCLCNQVKRIPEMFATRPMRVFVISVAAASESLPEADLADFIVAAKRLSLELNPMSVVADNKFPCTLYAESKKLADVVAACFIGSLTNLSLYYWPESIANGSSVFIRRVISHADIFIADSCCKRYGDLFSALAADCGPYAAPNDILTVKGDFVLVNVAGTSEFFRAEIKSCSAAGTAATFQVINIDTGATCDNIPLKLLRKPNSFLRSCPVYLKRVKLIYLESIPNPVDDNKALESLHKCQANAVEFNVKFVSHRMEVVDLLFQTKEQQSLSKKLLPLLFEKCNDTTAVACSKSNNSNIKPAKCAAVLSVTCGNSNLAEETPLPPSPPDTPVTLEEPIPVLIDATPSSSIALKETPLHLVMPNLNIKEVLDNVVSTIYTLENLEILPITVGDNVAIVILDASTSIDHGYITAADFSNPLTLSEMEKNLATVSRYCKCPHEVLKKGYRPCVNEICIAVYADDGEWYRALCLKVEEDNVFRVMFLDYGNTCKVTAAEIMPITKDLMFATNANVCYVEGLNTKEQRLAFSKAVYVSPVIHCKVTKLEDDFYTLEVNDLEKMIA